MGILRPLISILVPVYNVSQYLRQCLDSLVNQTLNDIEIICVNDGSTDDSASILMEYAKTDRRIVIVNKENGGLPSARNAGLDIAKGKYVGFVDADDYVDKDMYRKLYYTAKQYDSDIVVCGAHPFPNEEMAPQWLKTTLSPRDITYKANCIEAIFTECGAKPFLWRDLIRKDLIDQNHFRLDEDIVVGEDQAFQFKVFPVARRVTFVSDKLYYYRYSRPESIMNEKRFKDYGTRIFKHVNMIASIAESWTKHLQSKETAVRFFSWSVDFIYWDIIRVSAVDRVKIARKFTDILSEAGYYNYLKEYSWDTRKHFQYIYGLRNTEAYEPEVSIVVVVGSCSDYITRFLDSILNQKNRKMEVLLYENNTDDSTKDKVREYLYKDPRICIRAGEWSPVSEKYNDALITAKGNYIVFMNVYEYIQRTDWLDATLEILDGDPSVDIAGYLENRNGIREIRECQNANFRQFIYRMEKIRDLNLEFEDYSFFTGSVFFTKYCLDSKYVFAIPKFTIQREPFHRQTIYASEAKLLLRCMVLLLEMSKTNHLDRLAEHITDLLNSENYIRLITDSTYGFYIHPSSVNNPDEDFHAEILALLIRANEIAYIHEEDRSVLSILSVFIAKRHLFLEKI